MQLDFDELKRTINRRAESIATEHEVTFDAAKTAILNALVDALITDREDDSLRIESDYLDWEKFLLKREEK